MNLEEVLPAYREGKKIYRKLWGVGGAFCHISNKGKNSFNEAGLFADDWETAEEPNPKVKKWRYVYINMINSSFPTICVTEHLEESEALIKFDRGNTEYHKLEWTEKEMEE